MLRGALLSAILVVDVLASNVPISSVSNAAWKSLNQTVSGKVHRGIPVASPCYLQTADAAGERSFSYNATACHAFLGARTNSSWLAGQFGGYDNTQYGTCMATSVGCTISANDILPLAPLISTCNQGSVPDYYLDAHGASDVQAGLRFAKEQGINVVIKNSGHDYKGRSSGPNSLAIWTHNIRPAIQFTESFIADGCSESSGPALTFGAGQGFAGIYEKAHEHGYMVVGGTSASVGASGGWLTGGGHSALSTTLGLGVDNALQLRAVLPNGTYVTANRCQNQDLFFALRGGGGNAFGVIIETTTRAHKEVPLQMAFIADVSIGLEASQHIRNLLIDNTPRWAADGWGGYSAGIGPIFFLLFITPKLSLEEAKESMKPVSEFVQSLGNLSVPLTLQIQTVDSYWDYFNTDIAQALGQLNGATTMMSSRLISKSLFQGEGKKVLSDAMANVSNGVFFEKKAPAGILLVAPSQYDLPETDLPGGPGEASVTPAWREAYWHSLFQLSFDASDITSGGYGSLGKAFQTVSDSAAPFRDITPGGGAYQNEGDTYEPDVTTSFWGAEGYQRLLAIKKEIDPGNLLTCHQCVGWDATDPRWGCYPPV